MAIWWMELFDLGSALEEKIPTLLKLILQGSDAAFQQAKNELLDKLGICVTLCLDEVFSPERIAQRLLLVHGRLALEETNS